MFTWTHTIGEHAADEQVKMSFTIWEVYIENMKQAILIFAILLQIQFMFSDLHPAKEIIKYQD